MSESYTENLEDFGKRERKIAGKLLLADLPKGFNNDGVKLAFNRDSGYVFLVNSDYQCAMFNGDDLEIFHNTPYNGYEGFLVDLLNEYSPDELNSDDEEYLRQAAKSEGVDLKEYPAWSAE